MKARVKATGEIVDVIAIDGDWLFCSDGAHYGVESLEGIDHEIDYWTRLEHQYAGMAMQGILACEEWKIAPREGVSFAGEVALQAHELAHALVEKMKEERK